MRPQKPKIIWAPTPKQAHFLSCGADEVFYGGAAGGGKSDALLIASIGNADSGAFNNPNWRALILRRTFPELEKTLIFRSLQLFQGKGRYDGVKHRWTFPTGATLQFGHIKNEDDVVRHQGAEYNVICFDELTHFTERMYFFLQSRLRTTDPTIHCRIYAASNPGGLGHGWVKKRFIDTMEAYKIHREVLVMPDGSQREQTRAYVPATVYDNEHIMNNDPAYVGRLMGLPDAERRAFLNGDWNIFSGQFFTGFLADHVCEPFQIPLGWKQWISMDYGFATKCAIGFYTQDPESEMFYRWAEIYVSKTHPDVLSKMMKDRLGPHFSNLVGRFGDKRIMVKDEETNLSTKEKFGFNGFYFTLANDDRVEGWRRVHELFMKDQEGQVKFKVFNTCKDFLRVIPEQIHDLNNPEDLDRHGETHIPDELRYFSIMRKVREVKGYQPNVMTYSSVTGYISNHQENDDLLSRVKRLPGLKKEAKFYFLDRPQGKEGKFDLP